MIMKNGKTKKEVLKKNVPFLVQGKVGHRTIKLGKGTAEFITLTATATGHIYKKIELIGSSPTSLQDAIENAVARAAKTVRNLRWFEVIETRGQIEEGEVAHWQVTVKIGFTLEDDTKVEED